MERDRLCRAIMLEGRVRDRIRHLCFESIRDSHVLALSDEHESSFFACVEDEWDVAYQHDDE